MEVSKNGSTLTNNQVQVAGTLTYGGSLIVSNLGPSALAVGDRFPLFSASSYAGGFTNIILPPLSPGLGWTNKLLVDGSIEIISGPQFVSTSLVRPESSRLPTPFLPGNSSDIFGFEHLDLCGTVESADELVIIHPREANRGKRPEF